DVRYRGIQRVHDGRGDVEREVLGVEVLFGGRYNVRCVTRSRRDRCGLLVAVHGNADVLERGERARQERLGDVPVYQHGLRRVAHAVTLRLGVDQQLDGEVEVRIGVHVHVAVADSGLDHRDRGAGDHRADQSCAAARDEHVHQAARLHQLLDGVVRVAGYQLDRVARQTTVGQGVAHRLD